MDKKELAEKMRRRLELLGQMDTEFRELCSTNQWLAIENERLKQENFETGAMIAALVEKATKHEIFSRLISSLELTTRTENCLDLAGIMTIGQLVRCSEEGNWMNNRNLLQVRFLGRTSLRTIKLKLAELGLRLGMTELDIALWTPPPPQA